MWAFVARDYASADFTYTTVNPVIWGCVEVGITITCACLPSMKPVFSGIMAWYMKHKRERSKSRSSSPSNLFHRRLLSLRNGDPVSRQSLGKKNNSGLEEFGRARADREWRLSLGYVSPLLKSSSQSDVARLTDEQENVGRAF